MLRVVGCERVQVVSACRRLSISSTLDSLFPVYCASSPVLFGDSRSCQFAPYNTCYNHLWFHLKLANLIHFNDDPPCQKLNYWNSHLDIAQALPHLHTSSQNNTTNTAAAAEGAGGGGSTSSSISPDMSSQSSLISPPHDSSPNSSSPPLNVSSNDQSQSEFLPPVMLPPHQFHTLVIPERKQGTTDRTNETSSHTLKNPFPLPLEYAQVLSTRLDTIRILQQSLSSTMVNLPPSVEGESSTTQSDVEASVRAHFADWLLTSGNFRQVLDLVQLDRRNSQNDASDVSGASGHVSTKTSVEP